MGLAAGKLRNRIKVFAQKTTRSATGAVTKPTWEHVLTLWASFEPLSVKDVINSNVAGSDIVARCKLRYRHDIDHTMRVEHQGRTYEINGDPLTDPNSGKGYMTLMLKVLK